MTSKNGNGSELWPSHESNGDLPYLQNVVRMHTKCYQAFIHAPIRAQQSSNTCSSIDKGLEARIQTTRKIPHGPAPSRTGTFRTSTEVTGKYDSFPKFDLHKHGKNLKGRAQKDSEFRPQHGPAPSRTGTFRTYDGDGEYDTDARRVLPGLRMLDFNLDQVRSRKFAGQKTGEKRKKGKYPSYIMAGGPELNGDLPHIQHRLKGNTKPKESDEWPDPESNRDLPQTPFKDIWDR
ncbi:hypothetical protein B0H17DRAFT_1153196 [Mycena rosella]|uniref:Uncharacterized protein n=1 Tax=Mycena rosella TaxID=1033263 RepID=A0AAD7B8V2_MYCRO|nr:hypothetical protein B0H17DRAFT_1153196 [Mycena rosella]